MPQEVSRLAVWYPDMPFLVGCFPIMPTSFRSLDQTSQLYGSPTWQSVWRYFLEPLLSGADRQVLAGRLAPQLFLARAAAVLGPQFLSAQSESG